VDRRLGGVLRVVGQNFSENTTIHSRAAHPRTKSKVVFREARAAHEGNRNQGCLSGLGPRASFVFCPLLPLLVRHETAPPLLPLLVRHKAVRSSCAPLPRNCAAALAAPCPERNRAAALARPCPTRNFSAVIAPCPARLGAAAARVLS
jgi:hypothetical protein